MQIVPFHAAQRSKMNQLETEPARNTRIFGIFCPSSSSWLSSSGAGRWDKWCSARVVHVSVSLRLVLVLKASCSFL